MKKTIVLGMTFLIITIMSTISYAANSKAVVNVTAVRVREKASTESNIVTNIYEDDEVEILGEDGDWYKIKYGNYEGYAKSEFFTKKSDSSEQSENIVENTTNTETPVQNEETNTLSQEQIETPETKIYNVGEGFTLASTTKMRIIPSLVATEKVEIEGGSSVKVETKLGNWYKITDESVFGWITVTKLNEIQKQNKSTETTITEEESVTSEPEVPESTQPPEETSQNAATTEKKAKVIVETARVRNSASTKGDIIETLDEDEIVTIVDEEGDFYKITSAKISSGYISKSLVKLQENTSRGSQEPRDNTISEQANQELNEILTNVTSNSVTGSDIIEFAKQYLGYKYVLRM